MTNNPNSGFLRYGGFFLIGIGLVNIVIAAVRRTVSWDGLSPLISGIAYIYIGIDMLRRSTQHSTN